MIETTTFDERRERLLAQRAALAGPLDRIPSDDMRHVLYMLGIILADDLAPMVVACLIDHCDRLAALPREGPRDDGRPWRQAAEFLRGVQARQELVR